MNNFCQDCNSALDYAIQNKSFAFFKSNINKPDTKIHTHECCEVFLCIKGNGNFLIDDKIYDIKDQDLFFMNQFESHKVTFSSDYPVDRYVVQIHPEFMLRFSTNETDLAKCFYASSKCNKISLTDDDLIFFKNKLYALQKSYDFADDILKEASMLEFLARLNMLSSHTHPNTNNNINSSLRLALDYINGHYTESLRLDDIAKNSFISVNQLCKIFKENLGTTVSKYIIGKRISEAKKCLKNGYNVSDTAMMCGFGDYSNFIRTFSSCVGISPGKYIKSTEIL